VLDSSLPAAIPPTLYARFNDIPIAMIMAVAFIIVVRRRVAKQVL
jgi:apolipoprotein N-acyltransferase